MNLLWIDTCFDLGVNHDYCPMLTIVAPGPNDFSTCCFLNSEHENSTNAFVAEKCVNTAIQNVCKVFHVRLNTSTKRILSILSQEEKDCTPVFR